MSDDPHQVLDRIHRRLSESTALAALIEEMCPHTRAEAVAWARRLPGWDEYRDRYPDRVIALARLIARRGMRDHHLILTEDGRVTGRIRVEHPAATPKPSLTFPLVVAGAEVRVEYTPEYAPGQDHFQFRSPHEPVQPIPLSETGWYSHFAHPAGWARAATAKGAAGTRRAAARAGWTCGSRDRARGVGGERATSTGTAVLTHCPPVPSLTGCASPRSLPAGPVQAS